MLAVVCWKWGTRYTSEQVNGLARAFDYYYPHSFVFYCITDDPHDLDASIIPISLWSDFSYLRNPEGPDKPSCYRRLKIFDPAISRDLGSYILSLDIDLTIHAPLEGLFEIKEDFAIWSDFKKIDVCNGSLFMFKAGTCRELYDEFDPEESPRLARAAGFRGSDQAWLSYKRPKVCRRWGRADGVYSWRVHVKPYGGPLPSNCKIISWHGQDKPWDEKILRDYAGNLQTC